MPSDIEPKSNFERLSETQQPGLIAAIERLRKSGEAFSGVAVELSRPQKGSLRVDGSLMGGDSKPVVVLTITSAPDQSESLTEP